MTSTLPPSSTPNNPAQSATGASSTSVRSSYANATKSKPAGAPPIASSTSPAVVGGPAQHGKSSSISPVNGKPAPPTAPSAGAPAIVSSSIANGSTPSGDSNRKSSVTINAQSTTSYLPNGGSGAPPSRPNIHFGAMNPSGSPATAHSVPHNPQNANMGMPLNTNPGPARSPSPIPPAIVSGGRPPSAPQGQGTQLSFGNLSGGENSDQSLRPSPHAPIPASLAQSHIRSQSSQSQHGDMSGSMNRNFGPGGGRGRGYNPGFQGPNISHSPQLYRQSPSMPPRNLSNVQSFQPQGMRVPNSPYQATRSPAMPAAQLQQQPHMPNGQPMHPYGGYLGPQQNPGIYGVPPDQQYYANYYSQPYIQPNMHGMPYQPPSPRFNNTGHAPHQAFIPGPYQPPSHNMSRQSSHQGSDRAPSTVPQVPTPSISTANPPPVVSSSPAPPARTEPRKSKAIVIKNADGEIVDLKSISSQSPAPTQSRPPVVVSSGVGVPSTSTPPPKPAPETVQHTRTDSAASKPSETKPVVNAKSSEETKRLFTEQVKRQLAQEAGKKDDDDDDDGESSDVSSKAPEVVKPVEVKETPKEEQKIESEPAQSSAADDAEAARKKKEEEEEEWIRQLEEEERLEEERERAYQEKKKREAEEKAIKEKEAAAREEEDLKKAEREAEEREAAKEKGAGEEPSAESKALFASLKKPTMGPGATSASEASTPASEVMPPPPAPTPASGISTPKTGIPSRPKPSMLKLETGKVVEPAQPTAGMQSLRSARFLKIQNEDNIYPGGIRSPNPALNQGGKSRGRQYDKDFLMQFQEVFKEKPTVDWDKMLKDTVGDSSEPSSARPGSARTPSMGGRQNSRNAGPAMGSFAAVSGPRTLPAGTTSEQRFAASNSSTGPPRMSGSFTNPLAQFGAGARGGLNFPMVAPPMSRSGSGSSRGPPQNINSPRSGSTRERSHRNRGNTQQEQQLARTMPLTAGKDLKPLEVSKSGWKPASLVSNQPALPGHLTPDIVQRKVKASLNKMTPEKFDKISGDILTIAAQSKDENDGRTLRQVIQLTFEKACDEAHWASMYAKFCKRMLETMSPEIKDENVTDKHGAPVVGGALFRKYLLNRCQEEFERGWEVNLPAKPEGQTEEAVMLSDSYYIAAAAKRRGLGLIQFIGELYKLGMLTIRIMHECVIKLLNSDGLPEETTIESLVKLLRTIGATMDSNEPHGHDMVNMYFTRIDAIMKMDGLPSRMYYMLLDIVDLRRKNWESRDDNKGPKTIAEIRDEAARNAANAEMQRQRDARSGGRPPAGRGDARSFSNNMGGPPPDYHRNQVGIDDLKKLTRGARTNPSTASLGPTSLLSNSRSGSRRGLGPPRADDSGPSSRTGTPPVKDEKSSASLNTYSLLADSGDADNDVASPPSTSVSPALAKSTPVNKDVSKP